ncbi:MAG: nicotinamide riboside transporter PnuC [Gammaproteobacteria bacterium]
MLDNLLAVAAAVSVVEAVAVVLAIAYLVLAIRQDLLCWYAAFVSSLIYLWIFFDARLYMESALQVFYAGMAIFGWYQWRYGGSKHEGVRISVWQPVRHVIVIGGVLILSVVFGWALSSTDAAFPYLDSFTTISAIVTTYMVARKVLENWIYWFVIDGLSIYLYVARELYLTAGLFLFYLVLVVLGFRTWLKDWRAQPASVP